MKRGLISLALLLLLLPAFTSAYAQDEEDEAITVFINSQFNEASAALERAAQALESTLQATFSEVKGFALVMETDPAYAAVEVMLDLPPDTDILFVDLLPINPPPGFLPSPSLVPHQYSEFPLAAAPDDPAWQGITGQAIVALGAYIYGDCETATTYLQQVQDEIDNLQFEYFLGQEAQTIAYVRFYEASCALANEDYETAATGFEDVLALYDDNGFDRTLYGMAASLNLAWADYQLGNVDNAFSLVDTVVDSQFDWMRFDALLMRSELHLLEGDTDAALDALDEAEALQPSDDVDVMLRSVHLRTLAGDFKGAEAILTQLDKTMPDLPDTYYYEALLQRERGETAEAISTLETYLEEAPDGYLAEQVQSLLEELQSEG